MSSVKDKESRYYARSSPLKHHLEHPTALIADCRFFGNRTPKDGIDVCKRPQDNAKAGISIGSGLSLNGVHNAHYSGGCIHPVTGELVVAVYWGGNSDGHGAVLAVSLHSGDRRLVSGDLEGAASRGSGVRLWHAIDVRCNPGNPNELILFADPPIPSSHEIVAVDWNSGDRKLLWKSRDEAFPQLRGNKGEVVQTVDFGFAVEPPAAEFALVSVSNPKTGVGVVRVPLRGHGQPSPVTMASTDSTLRRGEGPDLRGMVQGFEWVPEGGAFIGFTTMGKQLLRVDMETGNRTLIIKGEASGALGERWQVWDSTRQVWWTAGLSDTVTIVVVDPKKKKALHIMKAPGGTDFPWLPLAASGPLQINSLNLGGMWMHPTDKDRMLFAHDSISIVEFEISTGNSRILSQ